MAPPDSQPKEMTMDSKKPRTVWDAYLEAMASALGRELTMDDVRHARHCRAVGMRPEEAADSRRSEGLREGDVVMETLGMPPLATA